MPDYTISQFDTSQYHQAYATLAAICGPNVAEAFAKYYGDTFSPDQIVNLAREQKLWSESTGMYGPQAEKALLDRLGIPVDYSPTLNIQDLTNKIQSGMTGALSTPGHYYFLQGYDPNTGLFDTGQTGSVYSGGNRYLSLDQMQKLSGPVSGVFTSRGPAGQSTGQANQTGRVDPNDIESVKSYIRNAAIARGIDPEIALAVANSEGLNTYVGDNNSSFGPFQLHYGGVASGGNSVSGLGDAFTKQTGLDARNPDTIAAQIDFALDNAASGGWGPWHGASRIGIGERTGIGSNAKAIGVPTNNASPPSEDKGVYKQNAALFGIQQNPLGGMYNNQPQLGIFGGASPYSPLQSAWGSDSSAFSPFNAPAAQPDIMSRMSRPWSVYG